MKQVTVFRSIADLVFDATFVEDHTSELEVTDNPIETGALVSDHAFMKPLRLSITAGVSAVLLPSGNPDFGTGEERPTTAYELFSELQKEREPFDVQTGLRIYENMMCINFQARQDKDTAGIFYFTAQLREVLIVDTETTTYPPRKAGATAQQANKTKAKGEQQGKTDVKTGNDGAKKSSLLNSAVNAFKGVTGSPPASAKK